MSSVAPLQAELKKDGPKIKHLFSEVDWLIPLLNITLPTLNDLLPEIESGMYKLRHINFRSLEKASKDIPSIKKKMTSLESKVDAAIVLAQQLAICCRTQNENLPTSTPFYEEENISSPVRHQF